MANNGSVQVTGLTEFKQAVERFPQAVTETLRAIAWRKSREVMNRAKALAPKATGWTRDHIHVIEDAAHKQFLVNAGTDQPRVRFSLHRSKRSGRIHTQKVTLNMVPVWLEFGTKFMTAKPFMRPAGRAVEGSYKAEMIAAAEHVAEHELDH